MRRSLLAIATFAALSVIGCVDAEQGDCTSAADCADGAFCQSGVCIEPCESDEACTDGRRCLDGVCQEVASCVETTDCEDGWVCEQRGCVPQEAECGSDRDCPPRFVCIEGGCYPPGLSCDDDDDCDGEASCVDGTCQAPDVDAGDPDTSTGVDTTPDDVADAVEADTTVDSDISTADVAPECSGTADCDPDEVCSAGVCVPDSDTGTPDTSTCGGRDDGQLGERCTAASDCCNGMCFGNPEAGRGVCSENCTSWRDCNPLGTGSDDLFCYLLTTPGLCATSDYLNSCASSDTCLGGRCLLSLASSGCTWDCETTSDCAPGSACGGVGFDVGGTPRLLDVCTPIGANCLQSSDCLSGTCLTDDGGGLGYCSAFCRREAATCPTGWSCQAPDLSQPDLYVCVR